MTAFQTDKQDLLTDLAAAREELLAVVRPLGADDLARSRRGSWSVARILEHVIQAEHLYIHAVNAITAAAAVQLERGGAPASADDAAAALDSARGTLLDAIGQATEDNFYEIKQLGHEEYSVLSVIENIANHDREHADQIGKTLEAA